MTPEQAMALQVLGSLRAETLPAIATAWVESGYESTSLFDLSSRASSEDPRELRDLASDAWRELGLVEPPKAHAAAIATRFLAMEIVAGRIAARTGAYRMIYDIYFRSGLESRPGELFGEKLGISRIAGAFYEFDEFPSDSPEIGELKRVIVDECRLLLDREDVGSEVADGHGS